jgi:hypothetical protein
MTDTSRYEGWLVAHYDIGTYTQGDMKDILSRDRGFSSMSKDSQERILDNWIEFEKDVVVSVPEDLEGIPAPIDKETRSFWKFIKRIFRRG